MYNVRDTLYIYLRMLCYPGDVGLVKFMGVACKRTHAQALLILYMYMYSL